MLVICVFPLFSVQPLGKTIIFRKGLYSLFGDLVFLSVIYELVFRHHEGVATDDGEVDDDANDIDHCVQRRVLLKKARGENWEQKLFVSFTQE